MKQQDILTLPETAKLLKLFSSAMTQNIYFVKE